MRLVIALIFIASFANAQNNFLNATFKVDSASFVSNYTYILSGKVNGIGYGGNDASIGDRLIFMKDETCGELEIDSVLSASTFYLRVRVFSVDSLFDASPFGVGVLTGKTPNNDFRSSTINASNDLVNCIENRFKLEVDNIDIELPDSLIRGKGAVNWLAKFSPNDSTIVDANIRDDGTDITFALPEVAYGIDDTSTPDAGTYGYNSATGRMAYYNAGWRNLISGSVTQNYLMRADANGNAVNAGLIDDGTFLQLDRVTAFKEYTDATLPSVFLNKNRLIWNNTLNGLYGYNDTRGFYVAESTRPTFTQGSVLFADANGQITQDEGVFNWDSLNNRLGLSENNPEYDLDVAGTIRSQSLGIEDPASEAIYLPTVDGGNFGSGVNQTGAIEIIVPELDNFSSIRFKVDVHEYRYGTKSLTVDIKFAFPSTFAQSAFESFIITGEQTNNYTVQLRSVGKVAYIYVGELTDTWINPQVIVKDVHYESLNGGGEVSQVATDWQVSFESVGFSGTLRGITFGKFASPPIETELIDSPQYETLLSGIEYPLSAHYINPVDVIDTGAIKITLPADVYNFSSIRFSIKVWGYRYTGGKYSFEAIVKGDLSTFWATTSTAYILTNEQDQDHTIRLSTEGGRYYVYIGELTDVWKSAHITISIYVQGNSLGDFDDGWDVGFEQTSFGTVDQIFTGNLVKSNWKAYKWNTSDRPASPENGDFGFNTDSLCIEVYNGDWECLANNTSTQDTFFLADGTILVDKDTLPNFLTTETHIITRTIYDADNPLPDSATIISGVFNQGYWRVPESLDGAKLTAASFGIFDKGDLSTTGAQYQMSIWYCDGDNTNCSSSSSVNFTPSSERELELTGINITLDANDIFRIAYTPPQGCAGGCGTENVNGLVVTYTIEK